MPNIDFFATRHDLLRVLRAVEDKTQCLYVPCYSDSSQPPTFQTAGEIPEEVFVHGTFYVCSPDSTYTATREESDAENSDGQYEVTMTQNARFFFFAAGGLTDNRYLQSGCFSTRGEDYTPDIYQLYRPFAQAVRQHFKNRGYLYGDEALQLGAEGKFYYLYARDPNRIVSSTSWLYQTLEDYNKDMMAFSDRTERLSTENTWAYLEALGYKPPRNAQGKPRFASRSVVNEETLSFFRTEVTGEEFSRLAMPGTFFARTGIASTTFNDTNLQGSFMCWNDWLDCDFSKANLAQADMRCSQFMYCDFTETDLNAADLRDSSFVHCDFTNAQMSNACLTPDQMQTISLSELQKSMINWKCRKKSEPPYG